MTTIAYDGRYIAIDSRLTIKSWIYSDDFDKTKETDDWVFFWSGSLHKKEEFEAAFMCNGRVSEPSETSMFAFHKITGRLYDVFSQDCALIKTPIEFSDAKGSGAGHAITAMDFGASAVDAIRAAMKRCNCTGGTIRCYDTKTKKFIKVK